MRFVYSSKSFSPLAYAMRLRACSLVFQSFCGFSTSSVFVFLSVLGGVYGGFFVCCSCFCSFFASLSASFLMSSPYMPKMFASRWSSSARSSFVLASARLLEARNELTPNCTTFPSWPGITVSVLASISSMATTRSCLCFSRLRSTRCFPISRNLSLAPSISYLRVNDFK